MLGLLLAYVVTTRNGFVAFGCKVIYNTFAGFRKPRKENPKESGLSLRVFYYPLDSSNSFQHDVVIDCHTPHAIMGMVRFKKNKGDVRFSIESTVKIDNEVFGIGFEA